MPPTLYRDTGYSLTHLIEDIKHGNIALPDIQRPFVWSATKARDLFDSMYRGYPIGTLMFWETGADTGTKQVGGGEGGKTPKLLIVDGQQRLTALFSVLTGAAVLNKSFQEKRIRLGFQPATEAFEVTDVAIERSPEFVADITMLWDGNYRSVVRKFLDGLSASRPEPLLPAEQDALEDRIDRVRDLRDFRFQVIELGVAADEEQVAEIFVRINSEGVKLNQSDFILTLMSVHWDKGRRQLEEFARSAVDKRVKGPSPRNPFLDPSPDQMLRVAVGLAFRRGALRHVYNILRGKDLDTGGVSPERRAEQFDVLRRAQDQVLDLTNWTEFLKCLNLAGFRSRRMITSESAIIYTYLLWLLGRRDFGVDTKRLKPVIARWFFMAQTTSRYSASSESQVESDLARIRDLPPSADAFCEELDRIVRANFTGDYWEITLPNRLDTSSARSPALYAYLAALNLLDAELLFSDLRIRELLDPGVVAPRSVERHHLFPRGHLATRGITDLRQVNAIANMAFLDWPDNAAISADDPRVYWPLMIGHIGQEKSQTQIYWHALPVGWEQLDYQTFLDRRRTLMAKVVRAGFERLWSDQPGGHSKSTDLADLIAAGESQTVELKSSARWNYVAQIHDRKMEHVIVKSVCGLLNSEGGSVVIGVADDGTVLGLSADFDTFQGGGNRDKYELFLRQLLDSNLSVSTAGLVKIRFHTADGENVSVVSVASSGKPAFAKPYEGSGEPSEFWVRTGNATRQLHGDDLIDYKEQHWG